MSDRHTQTRKSSLVRIGVAAAMLGVSVDTVRRWTEDNVLPVRRSAGGHRQYDLADIHAYLATQQDAA